MKRRAVTLILVLCALCVLCVLSAGAAVGHAQTLQLLQTAGRISGRVTRDNAPLAGVLVVVQETGATAWTSTDGAYTFTGLRPGAYTLLLSLGANSTSETVLVTGQSPVPVINVTTAVDWVLTYFETLVVTAPSRQVERADQAPAPVTRLDAGDVERLSAQALLPRLVLDAPGVQVTQSSLFDFNINTRGFNDLVNRRVRTEIDGRDASRVSVMGSTAWASIPVALDDIESVEFVRGAGGALYGAGAFNGVMSIRTKNPDASMGGEAKVTLGDLDTARVDARHSGRLGGSAFFKVAGGYQSSGDFARSRVTSVEYAPGLLPREVVPLSGDKVKIAYASVRVDRPLENGNRFVVEGGTADSKNTVSATNLGRYQTVDQKQPWGRAEFTSSRWRLLGTVTGEALNNSIGLSSGGGAYDQGTNLQISAETHGAFGRGRGRVIGGVSYGRQNIDSLNPQGVETIWTSAQKVNEGAVYGQADYGFTDRLRGSVAARVEATELHPATVSPRGAINFSIAPGHTARLAVGRAFKSPTVTEYRLETAIAPPVDLSALETALSPLLGGTKLGFQNIPLLAVGNPDLKVEELTGVDAGYTGLVGTRTVLNVSYYRNSLSTFTSGLLPQVGTSLGRLNTTYGPYRPPAGMSAAAAAALLATLNTALPASLAASMTNLQNGAPAFVVVSLGNFGSARTQGLEIGATTVLPDGWRINAAYSIFDYDLAITAPDISILPNTPRHQGSIGVSYVAPRFDAAVHVRGVSGFQWNSGVYAGPVPAYGVTDVQAGYPIDKRLRVGVDVSNLFNNEHYEAFGGDLIGRRALAHLTVRW